jgi:acyl carrier protein
MDLIEREIAAIVAEVAELDPSVLVPGAQLSEVEVDSLNMVEIAVDIERRFGIRFEEEELIGIETVERLAELARDRGATVA